ncbi:hypothetical protein PT974_01589 [Cladobotryum mycophilum]|uniref:Heterokaryon incompatibility domain-containing protein n=1 Tax=Cladobotryum mycophilum TaxID=491253 RepID=A0ABR0T413_9HYPO
MFRSRLPYLIKRSFMTSVRMTKRVELVCPICFDFGYTGTSMRGLVDDEATKKDETANLPSPMTKQPERKGNEAIAEGSLAEATTVVRNSGEEPLAAGTSQATTAERGKSSSSAIPFALSELMKHKDEKRIDDVYILPMDMGTVEPIVNGLLEGEDLRSEKEWAFAFAKAELIKNSMIPFKYWLEQPCPAHRNDEDQAAPCVAIRRGLHEYMLETNSDYTAKQGLMQMAGYVGAGRGSGALQSSFQVGHLEAGTTQASGWAIEGFLQDDIPSPWRKPWYPDQGLVICKRPTTSGDTASDEAFQKATNWYKECNETHPGCSFSEIPYLPERVLDIAAEDTTSGVKLILTNGKRERYACLSHRWGSETPSTTSNNIDAFQNEIPWDVLSPTYQDGVTFLRRFSKWHQEEYGHAIRYFWIDSLCILQDSADDWRDHSTKMSEIYSKSALTLVESFHQGNDKRLFQKSSPGRIPKPITVHDAEGNAREFYFRYTIHHPDIMINDDTIPIWTRAWVFQERLLSPRLLIFGSEELSWQCSGHNKCECGLDESEEQTRKLMTEWEHDIHIRFPSASSRKNLNLILGENPSHVQLRMAWRLMIEAYSQLHFTYRKDTMYAIAGLAKNFNARLGEKKYFAGIWYDETAEEITETDDLEDTTLDLLWRLSHLRDAKREDLPEAAVPITWSWAYPECPVVYPFVHDEVISYYSLAVGIRGTQHVESLPEDHESPRHWLDDMYKEVPPSAIIIGGPLWRTELRGSEISFKIKDTEDREYFYHLGEMSAKIYQEVAFGRSSTEDTFRKMPPIVFYPDNFHTPITGPLFCLPIAKFKHLPVKSSLEEKVIFAALVLEAVGHMATTEGFDPDLESKDPGDLMFRRLGLAYTTDGGWTEEHDAMVEKCPGAAVRIL